MSYGQSVQWMPGITLDQMEKSIIEAAYRFYRGNKTQTASALGISIRTLDNKMEKYDADRQADAAKLEERKRADAETLARFRGPELTQQFSTGSSSQWAAKPRIDSGGETNDGETHSPDAKNGNEATGGVRVQSTSPSGPEHALPVSQRKEVQSVLPRHASSHGSGKRR